MKTVYYGPTALIASSKPTSRRAVTKELNPSVSIAILPKSFIPP